MSNTQLSHFKIHITMKYAPHLSIAIEASSIVYPMFTNDDNLPSSSDTGFVISCKIDQFMCKFIHIISKKKLNCHHKPTCVHQCVHNFECYCRFKVLSALVGRRATRTANANMQYTEFLAGMRIRVY
jgi:hypothetical protein